MTSIVRGIVLPLKGVLKATCIQMHTAAFLGTSATQTAVNIVPATLTMEQSVDRLSMPGVPPKLLSANASKVSGAPLMLLS